MASAIGEVLAVIGDDGADVVRGVAGVGAFAEVFEEDRVGSAEVLFKEVVAFFGGEAAEVGGTVFAFRDGDVVRQFCGRGAFPFGVGEDMGVGERAFEESLAGFLEEFRGFAGESDKDVSADAEIGDGLVGKVDEVEEFIQRVFTFHGFENLV